MPTLLQAVHSTHSKAERKKGKLILMPKLLSNIFRSTAGITCYFEMQDSKVEVKNRAKPCHFPYKMVRNCAKANVLTRALLAVPQLL